MADSEFPLPKYARVVTELRRRIEEGEYRPGDMLPSEAQLVREFGIGRTTIVRSGTELLPAPWNARTRVHEYGGRSYLPLPDGDLVFANYDDQRLYRVTYAILRDSAEAEDVIQDAYVRAYQHLDQFAGYAPFSIWLTRIAVHEALHRLEQRKRSQQFQDREQHTFVIMSTGCRATTEQPTASTTTHLVLLIRQEATLMSKQQRHHREHQHLASERLG